MVRVMNEMTHPRIRYSGSGSLKPSTLPLGHGVPPQILTHYEWAEKKHCASWNLEATVGFEPTIHAFSSRLLLTTAPGPPLYPVCGRNNKCLVAKTWHNQCPFNDEPPSARLTQDQNNTGRSLYQWPYICTWGHVSMFRDCKTKTETQHFK